jgi:hypothetical protein
MREDFLLEMWYEKSEEVTQKDEPFLAIPDTVEMRVLSPVSSSETVETAFLEEHNKINKNGRDIL